MVKRPIVLLVASAMAASAPGAAAAPVWGGKVWHGEPIVITADAKAKRVMTIVFAETVTCKNGDWFPFAAELTTEQAPPGFLPDPRSLTVKKNARGVFNVSYVAAGWASGDTSARLTFSISGVLRKTDAFGLVTARGTIYSEQDGHVVSTCSGPAGQTFKADRKPGAVFGGSTDQQEPLVLRFDARHKRVKQVGFSWSGNCSGGGYIHFGDDLIENMRTLRGAFRKLDHATFNGDNGGTEKYDYDVKGKVGRRWATGTISPTYAEFDAAGTLQDTCTPGALSWSATSG